MTKYTGSNYFFFIDQKWLKFTFLYPRFGAAEDKNDAKIVRDEK